MIVQNVTMIDAGARLMMMAAVVVVASLAWGRRLPVPAHATVADVDGLARRGGRWLLVGWLGCLSGVFTLSGSRGPGHSTVLTLAADLNVTMLFLAVTLVALNDLVGGRRGAR